MIFFILGSLLDRGMQPINYKVPPRSIVSYNRPYIFFFWGGRVEEGGAVQLNSNVMK